MSIEYTCPKCQAAMRAYERNGIVIEQCTECRGIFLDRGELDTLIATAAEPQPAAHAMSPSVQAHPQSRPQSPAQPPAKRRRSFLEDLFE